MGDTVISVEHVAKKYRLGQAPGVNKSLRDTVTGWFSSPMDLVRQGGGGEEFWALHDVSFELKRGEVVGIIGRNGAGKSTLLKILSRVTEPTRGHIEIRGRVGSLLEVGTGFHPELTGRENIFLNGAILGMRRAEIARKFDEIVAFAEVEKFIDTPVRHYSSGMYLRLAFAVAAHLEPEILIVDEVLAVGDISFQKKCLEKMDDISHRDGRAILFVSHSMGAVRKLCNRAILLKKGVVEKSGETFSIIKAFLDGETETPNRFICESPETAPGQNGIRLLAVMITAANGQEFIDVDSGVAIECEFQNDLIGKNLDFTMEVMNQEGVLLFHSWVIVSSENDSKAGKYRTQVEIPGSLLNEGNYSVNLQWGENCTYLLFKAENFISIDVASTPYQHKISGVPGIIRPNLNWRCEYLSE